MTLSTPDLVFSNKHPFSISVWVYPSSTTRTDKFYLVSQASSSNFSSGYNLYFTTDAQHRYITHFTTAAKEYVFNQPILPSVWTNLVATFDGTNQRLFINGVEASGTLASNVVMSPSTAQVWIGGVRSATYAYILNYLGVMDELFIYDRVLADGEIKALSQLSGIHDPLATESPANSACQLTASQEITVTVDTDTPTVSITSPANGAFLNGNRYQVIGGEAHDPTSFIRLVEVSVDGGPYVPASGAESWAYTWDLRNLAPGVHTLDARATDALGHVSPVSRVGIKIDRTAPTVSWEWWNTSWVWPAFIRFRDMQTWYFDLEGTASDSSSGLASVEVLFDGGPGLPYGGWQAARIDTATGKWYLDYTFPLSVTDLNLVPNPSGSYALRLRATDKVGNITEITDPQPARMDNEAPVASLFNLNPTAVITQPLTLSGVVTDTTSTFRLSVGLVPVEQVEVMRDAALVMHLNEKWNSNYLNFMDASGLTRPGTARLATPRMNCIFPEK